MSQVKISGNASGTGILTVAAPNTNSDYTLTLPAETGTVLTSGGAIDVNASAPADSVAIDSSGRVGIGTSSPSFVAGGGLQISNASQANLRLSDTTNAAYNFDLFMNDSNAYVVNRTSGSTLFFTANTERMRIDSSGNLGLGTSSTGDGKFKLNNTATGTYALRLNTGRASGETGYQVSFTENDPTYSGNLGSITTNGSSVAYNTTSDYRLKENIAPMTGALATVAALNPVTYTWKINGSAGQGFIAHELQAVVPDCVTGEKDAVETYTDEEGNEQTRPVYQGVDTSFLVATLTAAIQELSAKNDALEARIAALEATA